jgi:hypothetical protein
MQDSEMSRKSMQDFCVIRQFQNKKKQVADNQRLVSFCL